MTKDTLDDLFAAARVASPAPPMSLSERVLADALAHQAHAAVAVPLRAPSPARVGLWAWMRAALGGGGAMAGMVAATLGGFYIGFAAPVETAFLGAALGIEMTEIEMMPGLDALLEEVP
jgi:hypothetical protein